MRGSWLSFKVIFGVIEVGHAMAMYFYISSVNQRYQLAITRIVHRGEI